MMMIMKWRIWPLPSVVVLFRKSTHLTMTRYTELVHAVSTGISTLNLYSFSY